MTRQQFIDRMCQDLDISRARAEEALRRLEEKGLVEPLVGILTTEKPEEEA